MSLPEADWKKAFLFLEEMGAGGTSLDTPSFRLQAESFLNLLLEKNRVLNLTGAKDIKTAFWKHLIDSLTICSFKDLGSTLDWGCGGGFPGIPLALARRQLNDPTPVFFVDSVGKKVRAVEEFCEALGLDNTRAFIGRGEVLIRSKGTPSIKTVVLRAVAPAERAWRWVDPAVENWLFFLGPRQRQEWLPFASALKKKGFAVRDERAFSLPDGLGERCLLRISKCST